MNIRFLKMHNNHPKGAVISINDNRGERLISLGIAEKTTAKETEETADDKEKKEGSPVTEKRVIKAASEKVKK